MCRSLEQKARFIIVNVLDKHDTGSAIVKLSFWTQHLKLPKHARKQQVYIVMACAVAF